MVRAVFWLLIFNDVHPRIPCFLGDSLFLLPPFLFLSLFPLSIYNCNTNSSSSPVWSRHDVYLSFLFVMQWWSHLSAITSTSTYSILCSGSSGSSVHHKVIGSKSASPQDCLVYLNQRSVLISAVWICSDGLSVMLCVIDR